MRLSFSSDCGRSRRQCWRTVVLMSGNVQVGCGVGNSSIPLAASNTSAVVHSCDYSPTAVRILQSAPGFQPERMSAFVADITRDQLTNNVAPGSMDVITCIFALSANSMQGVRGVRSVFAIATSHLSMLAGIELPSAKFLRLPSRP
jgi:Methyltransferase domain